MKLIAALLTLSLLTASCGGSFHNAETNTVDCAKSINPLDILRLVPQIAPYVIALVAGQKVDWHALLATVEAAKLTADLEGCVLGGLAALSKPSNAVALDIGASEALAEFHAKRAPKKTYAIGGASW